MFQNRRFYQIRQDPQPEPDQPPRASVAPGIAALVVEKLRHRLTVFAAVSLRVGGQQTLKQPPGERYGFAVGHGGRGRHDRPPACAARAGLPIRRLRRATCGHLGVTQRFGPDGPLAERGQAVVAAAFIVQVRVGAFIGFLDHPGFQEALDGAVQGAGAHLDPAAGALGHFLHDGVAVAFAVRQRQQDVKYRGGERGHLARFSMSCRHNRILRSQIYPLRIYSRRRGFCQQGIFVESLGPWRARKALAHGLLENEPRRLMASREQAGLEAAAIQSLGAGLDLAEALSLTTDRERPWHAGGSPVTGHLSHAGDRAACPYLDAIDNPSAWTVFTSWRKWQHPQQAFVEEQLTQRGKLLCSLNEGSALDGRKLSEDSYDSRGVQGRSAWFPCLPPMIHGWTP